jgi:ATP-dependent Lon protease
MDIETLDQKINLHFSGKVVRKDLTKAIKGNSVVPTYVLEYLLGQYCATDDEESIQSGIERVKKILAEHFVHRKESKLVQSNIREKGNHRVIDKVTVELNPSRDVYEATFMNLGLKKIKIGSDFARKHPKLLVGGIWCIVDLKYEATDEKGLQPWILEMLKPIQVSNFDDKQYLLARAEFETEEWLDFLMQSIGLNPEMLSHRAKLLQLIRLIPFCERNYNLIELGPKGTGKSHVFSEFSPHGILVSGGEITVAKLFVNNANAKVGLVGFWDSVAFDEFAGKEKRVDKNLVDIMKNYMANKSFSRGIDSVGAEASMSFLGNTKRNVAYMMRHTHFFEELPDKYIDSAFLDRLHCYLPGWETQPVRSELFSDGFGFIVDYLAEGLKYFRNLDFSHHYKPDFELNSDITTRDRDGILKTFSGLMKIIYPHEKFEKVESEEILQFSIEMRKRVKDQLLKIDETFTPVSFSYVDLDENREVEVKTLEEIQYPKLAAEPKEHRDENDFETTDGKVNENISTEELKSGEHRVIQDNMKGVSYHGLFTKHLEGARSLIVEDPYIRANHQLKNLMEFLEMYYKMIPDGEEAKVHLVTVKDDDLHRNQRQEDDLNDIMNSFQSSRLQFSFEFKDASSSHARSIQTDTGWKISLDRGLDIFQPYEFGKFSLASKLQEERLCKKFEITYLRK